MTPERAREILDHMDPERWRRGNSTDGTNIGVITASGVVVCGWCPTQADADRIIDDHNNLLDLLREKR